MTFPVCPNPKCGHSWHGLPCKTCRARASVHDDGAEECATSCSNLPIIPKGTGEDE